MHTQFTEHQPQPQPITLVEVNNHWNQASDPSALAGEGGYRPLTADEAYDAISSAHYIGRSQENSTADWLASMDDSTRENVVNILVHSQLGGWPVPEARGQRSSNKANQWRLASIYAHDPETAELIAENNIIGFHGTRSSSLVDILEDQALLTAYEANKRGRTITTGELVNGLSDGDRQVAFANWASPHSLDRYAGPAEPLTLEALEEKIAENEKNKAYYIEVFGEPDEAENPVYYDRMQVVSHRIELLKQEAQFVADNPDSLRASLILANFPISFGLSGNGYTEFDNYIQLSNDNEANRESAIVKFPYAPASSDIDGEFAAAANVDLTRCPVVAVPSEYMGTLHTLLENYGNGYRPRIVPLESLTT